MERVAGIDKGLAKLVYGYGEGSGVESYHEKRPRGVVEKDGGSYNEHGEADELV